MSTTVAVRGTLAEQVLLSILDAQPVDVSEIRRAIEQLQSEPAPVSSSPAMTMCAQLVVAAAEVVTTLDHWFKSFDDDAISMDADYDRFMESIAALRPILGEMGQ